MLFLTGVGLCTAPGVLLDYCGTPLLGLSSHLKRWSPYIEVTSKGFGKNKS